ncbi:tRNA dimethylallyltransferase [Jatrophihabitans endophyticus]|uniref:tRNA dimethylallyltransferase n=1 Tax=Jatrophihabitans endophyticus TaxID=1206085 RepID=A0A1M5LVQ8_9ACTN|nr:tRNA (adenosine(37)-N6)-dimethylallyltransferase MiaA [Jatrophihabitans endophyticus]SHG69148.1 tRNA dimethylallyltransferase [Jatrophihabitans endophyticus]
MPGTSPRVLAVVGPTATGKSELAIALAQRLDGEIVNADSMQLYEGMDVGTAKVPPAERGGVPHHLLDVWPLAKSAAVAQYQTMARDAIAEIHGRGRLPILVGGSGLYLRGALDDLDFPGEDAAIRARLYAELDELGAATLHARLAGVDPEAAAAILPSNGRRIARALEVIELTGGPFVARMPGFESIYDTVQLGLDRADLDERVELRVHRMVEQGLVAEIRALLPRGLRAGPTAGKALGYQQLLAVVDDAGDVIGDLDDAVAQTVRGTLRFVRRQRRWFRRDPRVRWLDGAAPHLVGDALRRLDA